VVSNNRFCCTTAPQHDHRDHDNIGFHHQRFSIATNITADYRTSDFYLIYQLQLWWRAAMNFAHGHCVGASYQDCAAAVITTPIRDRAKQSLLLNKSAKPRQASLSDRLLDKFTKGTYQWRSLRLRNRCRLEVIRYNNNDFLAVVMMMLGYRSSSFAPLAGAKGVSHATAGSC